ncbi:putative 3-oxoacyl-reductase [Talaromyces proteolyticus]|uniref:3-oxoacyl-reductase n=1 Tax=Talaromyces proteolyticus TaxID=1131652 RepID=A0AAD4KY21_9EURO|nr:putative 3-oxoacyl-reductase [Talaromyces proteolyticus]KAH8698616.1 putative 3-oxoacyl-reductase [Talaromyces proteolyticus]
MTAPSTKLASTAVWFVTGCSSGLGKAIVQTALNAGQHVVATARNVDSLSYLPDSKKVLKLRLDVTSKESIVKAIRETVEKHGRLDVVVNNAGYSLTGDTEAIPEEDARQLIETLYWGPVFIMQEAVRVFREVNPPNTGGTVINISSMGGSITVAGNSFYHAGKFALEGFTKSIAQEMKPEWNIRFMLVAPGGVRTNFAGSKTSSMKVLPRHPAYDSPSHPLTQLLNYLEMPGVGDTWGDPEICAKLMYDTVVGKYDRPLPTRLLMGGDAVRLVKQDIEKTLQEIEIWEAESKICSPNGGADLSGAGK